MDLEKIEGSVKYKDPVCGTWLPAKDAKGLVIYRGTTFYFCSESCAREFNEKTERFVVKISSEESSSSKQKKSAKHKHSRH